MAEPGLLEPQIFGGPPSDEEGGFPFDVPHLMEPSTDLQGATGPQSGELDTSDPEKILRQLGLASIPTQQARIGAAVTDLLPQIQGSPAEIRASVNPQITAVRNNLSQVFDAISQRLGRFGGGQTTRERGRAVGAAGGQLQQLFAGQSAQAFQQLLQTLGGVNPVLIAQPPLQTATRAIPPDFGQVGGSLLSVLAGGQRLFGGSTQPTGTAPAPLPAQFPPGE